MNHLRLILLFCLLLTSCAEESSSSGSGDNFNRTAMLTHWADDSIIPSYTDFQTKVNALETAVQTFNANTNQTNLDEVRLKFVETYKAFQHIGFYAIGKAEEIKFLERTNRFPVNTAEIISQIDSGSFDFSLISQYNLQGLPVLDYLLNGIGIDDSAILDKYKTDENYRNYLLGLVLIMKSNIEEILSAWNGGYRNTFINNSGNSPSSSTNLMVNNYIFYFEKHLRAGKVGIPAGIFSGGTTKHENVEAYYKKDISKILLQESISAAKNFFNGKHFNSSTEGESLKSYLVFLGRQSIVDAINNNFNQLETKVNSVDSNFVTQINSNNDLMIETYDGLQKLVVNFKLDMIQAFNINLGYADTDSD